MTKFIMMITLIGCFFLVACEDGSTMNNETLNPLEDPGATDADADGDTDLDTDTDSGTNPVSEPVLIATLSDRWHEAWVGSPARLCISWGSLRKS